ncbi:MAG: hypothetical protein BM558_06230 [Roseobacter sp. MedPE-SW]|nr:MAG: hypothetical protein BM558_06230 [Roseobacter sp. MedPE-SW]
MTKLLKSTLGYVGVFLLTLALPVTAQQTGETGGSYGSDPGGSPTGRSPATQVTSVPQLATRLSKMKSLCATSGGYVVDCLAERIETLGLDAANMSGHTELKQILQDTAEELRLLARANSDKTAPRARISSNDGQRSARPLVAVTPNRRASVQRQAITILQEAETKLLRSSTQSAARASQYQQVAAALGSNKVLLRS